MTLISPRNGSYERLEGGMGPSRPLRRLGWKQFVVAAALFVVLLWLWRSRSRTPPELPTIPGTHPLPVPPVHDEDTPSHPTSFSTDPNPSKTTYCTEPFKPTLPLVQFALMIDAGSTGSRIHVYKFNNCGPSPAFEYELFDKTQPGLSAYVVGTGEEAAASLDVLMDRAMKVVPVEMRGCTPVAVKATAGLRLVGVDESRAILEAVEKRLRERYPFRVVDGGAVIMDGKDEGVYAWITANYLLGTIRGESSLASSYAVLDLGGASTQIVFEPTFSKPDSSLVEGEHKYDLSFAGKSYVLYQHSYLGYGLMRARKSVHRLVEFMAASLRSGAANGPQQVIPNPCLAKGTRRDVEMEERNVTMAGEDIGSYQACNRVVQLVLAKDAICEVKPCSFDGVYQPSLLDTFSSGHVLLLSYFYDRLHPLLPHHNPDPLTVSTFASLAHDVCNGKPTWEKNWGHDANVMNELEGRPEWCLDLTFMHALLRLGYEFGDDREVRVGKQIDGTELGWALGATLAMVAGEVTCRL